MTSIHVSANNYFIFIIYLFIKKEKNNKELGTEPKEGVILYLY